MYSILLVCFRIYRKSDLRYKFLILDASRPDALYLRNKDARIRIYFPRPKGAREQISLGNTGLYSLTKPLCPILSENA